MVNDYEEVKEMMIKKAEVMFKRGRRKGKSWERMESPGMYRSGNTMLGSKPRQNCQYPLFSLFIVTLSWRRF